MDQSTRVKLRRLRPRLLVWYDGHRRSLPWRDRPTPYRVLISEFMLQQTQVDKVLPYFKTFTRRFPSFKALAAAELDEVLGLWAGLGYYSRARNLHRTARLVMQRHGGRLPDDERALRALPGIGPYTAAAIRSIAFGLEAALVDGNVERVVSRLLALCEHPALGEQREEIAAAAAVLVRGERPGDLNQALMELGALVCRPGTPSCDRCPLTRSCVALRQGLQAHIPLPRTRAARRELHLTVGLVEDGDRLLMCRRPDEGMFGGLWELPSVEAEGRGAKRALKERVEALVGTPVQVQEKMTRTERTLTHRDLVLDTYRVSLRGQPKLKQPGRFMSRDQLPRQGISSAMKAVLAKVTGRSRV